MKASDPDISEESQCEFAVNGLKQATPDLQRSDHVKSTIEREVLARQSHRLSPALTRGRTVLYKPRKRNGSRNMKTTFKTETAAAREIVPFCLLVCFLVFALVRADVACFAQPTPVASPAVQTQNNTAATDLPEVEPAPPISFGQLESLVAPIALYPDPLLIQVLAASTYPLEIVQLKQWLDENKKLKNKALAEAVSQQNWDPSVQALVAFPGVVDKLANKIQWTTDVGNAFLSQQSDVMDAVQRLRAKAQANGALKTNDKQKVATETTENSQQAITIEPAQRGVVYVPTYKTEVVYSDSSSSGESDDSDYGGYSGYSGYSSSSGSSGDDYSYAAYYLAAAYGAAATYWGYYNWRDRSAEVNYDNYYNNRYSRNWNNKVNNWSDKVSNSNSNANNWNRNGTNKYSQLPTQGQAKWQHNPSHRGNAPYGDRDLANQFGQGNNRVSGAAGNRTSQPATARAINQLSQGNRLSQPARGNAGNQLARDNLSRPDGGGARPHTKPPGGGAPNRVGNRMPSNWPNGARGGAFGPSNGDLARSFSGRGAQSMAPSRMGPPQGLRAGGPPAGGFHGGPPMGGGFHGGPPMGGFHGGPPMGGGLPGGGAPPPPPPPGP
jgi:hypothetical protein